ncbi:MAG TPA: hypothetical protein VMB85_16660 [Bryobacteraceae bacterium]|nr:hypothetical protein [Bryobacteraceae bacterium]
MKTAAETAWPIALADLEIWERSFKWVVRRCPLCSKKRHVHGGGLVGEDPRRMLGHRAGHCDHADNRGYILVDADSAATESILRRFGPNVSGGSGALAEKYR